MLYPFFAMFNLSFVPNGEIYNQGGKIFYSPLTLENYANVFSKIPIWKYFINSLFVALVTTLGQVIISALAGYAFARMKFKFRDALFLIILITMLVPPQVNIIPLFFSNASISLDKYLSSFNFTWAFWRIWNIYDETVFSWFA